jgi:hypothetical protein
VKAFLDVLFCFSLLILKAFTEGAFLHGYNKIRLYSSIKRSESETLLTIGQTPNSSARDMIYFLSARQPEKSDGQTLRLRLCE